ncbi:hypothetical protein NA56DRAFT_650517 [Hyaloscypha hepaticicola]|uniref:C2H2-type domain-containing protein n=1 Tax=Hyaloscypha hepaticicola TaxID=2082293 RepID=A0A2J6PLP3_9HELO|nr:hypothetical protein NA56DRAFT_650517 [Hyaloscypha hepaticicola]
MLRFLTVAIDPLTEEALQQHLRDSQVHARSFDCDDCLRAFDSEEALQQHLWDPRIHQQDTETPLDVLFRSFPTFDYDPSLPPATSYANLHTKDGAVAVPRPMMRGIDIKTRYKANCTCSTVQRTI